MQRTIPAREIIFREGDAGDYAYVLLSGKVEVLKHATDGEVKLAELDRGAVFGEMALFEPWATRSASIRTLEECQVEMLSAEEFNDMLNGCPDRMIPFLTTLIERLRDLNNRVAAKERATVLLEHQINSITITGGSSALSHRIEQQTIYTSNLPFSIGGYENDSEILPQNNLDIAYSGEPIISKHHCMIEKQDDGVYVVDQGSRTRTTVNGNSIGRARASFKAPLVLGKNEIILGDSNSPYILHLECS
jgi:CRP-like cAMP-binding protein